jgi:hypothetical protein
MQYKTFAIKNDEDYLKPEHLKQELENKGFKVSVSSHGFNNIKIKWW